MPHELLVAAVIVIFSCVAVLEVTTSKEETSVPTVVNQYDNHGPDDFFWGYKLSDNRDISQSIYQVTLDDGRETIEIDGSYSYVGPDGNEYKVQYIADENGYRLKAKSKAKM
ncbi:hypothetical protein RP20_CCG026685 [Aedes albopictus]|nr:hypothetical protein RP20_CCG026685 [Aedes albopictus]